MNGQLSIWIKEQAKNLGFDYCGMAKAEKLYDDEKRLTAWLENERHGSMRYMENYFEQRLDPRLLVDGAKSVITLLMNYYPSHKQPSDTYQIASYAYGEDYHQVIRQKLNALKEVLTEKIGLFNARGFVDSAPVLERSWAVKSGLGWVGKNGNLITKQQGSFFFIATLVLDVELATDEPFLRDYCGTCTKCIDACPTEAILPNKEINGSQCISYFTIELKDTFIQTDKRWNDWIFGCDICQNVCPWNRFSQPHHEEAFKPITELMNYSRSQFEEMTEENFKAIFKHSPIKRSKYLGFMRNIQFLKSPEAHSDD